MKLDIERIGKLVEYVDYNHTYKSWDKIKKYLKNNSIYYSCYKMIGEDGEYLGWEIKVSTDDCQYEKIEKMWEDFKLVGDPVNLDYIVFYYEDEENMNPKETIYAIIKLDSSLCWDIIYVTDDKEDVSKKFTSEIENCSEKIESEGPDYAIFENAEELWVVSTESEVPMSAIQYIIFYEDGEGFKIEGAYPSYPAAMMKLEDIIKEYKEDGINLTLKYDEGCVFENDDFFKVKRVAIKNKIK